MTNIHKTLYSFSNNRLHTLLRNCDPFRFILRESLSNTEQIFNIKIKKSANNIDPTNEMNEDSMENSDLSDEIMEGTFFKTTSKEDIQKGLVYM